MNRVHCLVICLLCARAAATAHSFAAEQSNAASPANGDVAGGVLNSLTGLRNASAAAGHARPAADQERPELPLSIKEWTVEDVARYIRAAPHEKGLSAEAFLAQEVDGPSLAMLTDGTAAAAQLLRSFGPDLGLTTVRAQLALTAHVQAFRSAAQPQPLSTPMQGTEGGTEHAPSSCLPSDAEGGPTRRGMQGPSAAPAPPGLSDASIAESFLDPAMKVPCEVAGECGTDALNRLYGYVTGNLNPRTYPFMEMGPARVGLQVSFQKMFQADIPKGKLSLAVWFRVAWHDPRLAWNPADHANYTVIYLDAHDVWVPEIELWNMAAPLAQTLVPKPVMITSEGHAFWSRPGSVAVQCKFQLLDLFPYDKMQCEFEIGSWTQNGQVIQLECMHGSECASVYGSHTSGMTYTEYNLEDFTGKLFVYGTAEDEGADGDTFMSEDSMEAATADRWPTVRFIVRFSRATAPYLRNLVLPQVFLAGLSCCVLWIDSAAGERLGVGITTVLASVAFELTVSGQVPWCNELLWLSQISALAASVTLATTLVSCVAVGCYYSTNTKILVVGHWANDYGVLNRIFTRIFNKGMYDKCQPLELIGMADEEGQEDSADETKASPGDLSPPDERPASATAAAHPISASSIHVHMPLRPVPTRREGGEASMQAGELSGQEPRNLTATTESSATSETSSCTSAQEDWDRVASRFGPGGGGGVDIQIESAAKPPEPVSSARPPGKQSGESESSRQPNATAAANWRKTVASVSSKDPSKGSMDYKAIRSVSSEWTTVLNDIDEGIRQARRHHQRVGRMEFTSQYAAAANERWMALAFAVDVLARCTIVPIYAICLLAVTLQIVVS